MWLLFQYSVSKFHLLIQQIREGVAIVSVQCIKLHLIIKQIRKSVAIVSVQCIYTYILVKKVHVCK